MDTQDIPRAENVEVELTLKIDGHVRVFQDKIPRPKNVRDPEKVMLMRMIARVADQLMMELR